LFPENLKQSRGRLTNRNLDADDYNLQLDNFLIWNKKRNYNKVLSAINCWEQLAIVEMCCRVCSYVLGI